MNPLSKTPKTPNGRRSAPAVSLEELADALSGIRFRLSYRCPKCWTAWKITTNLRCSSQCPKCGKRSIDPIRVEKEAVQ